MCESRDPVEVELEEISTPTVTFTKCGHPGPAHFKLKIWDAVLEFKVPPNLVKKIGPKEIVDGICPECFATQVSQSAIRCCKCGGPILVGDDVTLYPKDDIDNDREVAEYISDTAIGCLRRECCGSAGYFAGHWTTAGFKSAFKN